MPAITVRNLSEETHRALKARAVANGRSTEAEVRAILKETVSDSDDAGFGTRLAHVAAGVGGFDLDLQRDDESTEPVDLT